MNITNEELYPLLRDFFKAIPDSGIKTIPNANKISRVVDNIYSTVTKSEIINTIKTNPLFIVNNSLPKNAEIADCDDYALQLKSSITSLYRARSKIGNMLAPPAVGIVITQNHALNIVLCQTSENSYELFLIDPSSENPQFINDIENSLLALKTLPISLIYI
ncbi:hypothetical protein ACK32U_15105 [Aeromonas dhakensis]|uniref:hypothetical protein n=1 Tax=Aeromonas dhakensis TaxID=196024 RepID=UPI003989B715